MLSVTDALAQALQGISALGAESQATDDAVGRVLAVPVRATVDLPPFTNSSMDGYAVRAADVRDARAQAPVMLAVVGDIPAGAAASLEVRSGTAARIMTGAGLPAGADAVIPVEFTDDSRSRMGAPPPASIRVHQPVGAGDYVRPQGEDVQAGDVAFDAGTRLRPYDLGLLAAFGLSEVPVVRRPRVAILSTGDELVAVDHVPGPGQVRDTNGVTLAALARSYGAVPLLLGVARDQVDSVHEKLRSAVDQRADLIVSSAGVSVGAYDVVKAAVEREGSLEFWTVRMRPGKPLTFGRFRGLPFFGLPGNPVSAVVAFEVFVRPALLKMGGSRRLEKPQLNVVLGETLHSDGRETYLRAIVTREGETYLARSAGGQGSNILTALTRANALVIIPEGVKEVRAGSASQAWMLDWPEELL